MSGGTSLVIQVGFWSAFIIDLLILFYALHLSKKMGGTGSLQKTTLFAGASALVFGIHHVMELFLEEIPAGIAAAEGVEGIAAILLSFAVYHLYKLTEVK